MTRRNLLSDPAVNSKKKLPGYYLDGHGLYLQVTKTGSRSWIFRYTKDKNTREMGLGSVDAFSLAQARERARVCRQQLADGWDPIHVRNAEREERAAAKALTESQNKTFQQCAEECLEANAPNWKNAKHADQWINTLTKYAIPKFGTRPINSLTKQHIVDALAPIWTTKAETATRVFQRVRTVLNFAAAKDYCTGKDSEFWEQVKLALGSNERARKVEHHSSCPHRFVGSLLQAVDEGTSSDKVKLALRFIVLTASRSGEVRGATWDEVSEDLKDWIVPAERMKAERPHHVPLSIAAQETLKQAKEAFQPESSNSLIFPSPRGKVLSDMVFTQMLRRMDVPFTVHGFRASFRTWGDEATDYPHEMLEFALAHAVGDQTVRAYARGSMVERRRQLMQDWATHVASSRKIPFDSKKMK